MRFRREANPLAAVARRRSAVAIAIGVLVVGAIAATLSLSSSGSNQSTPAFLHGGRAVALAPPHARPKARRVSHPTEFRPAPAAAALARTMPLERQVLQLFIVGVNGTSAAAVPATNWGGFIIGSSNFVSDSQVGALAGGLASTGQGAAGVPPLVAVTQEGGSSTALPDLPPESEPIVAGSGQPAIARAQAALAARRLRALGLNMTLAPLADVDTPGGALGGRLFSPDPATVGRFSVEAIRGYGAARMISAVGHFPGSGGASGDPDQMTATVGGTLDALRARDLIPFESVAPVAPVIVMSNALYAAFDGVTPAGLLPQAVSLLRGEYRFRGVVMSDDLDATLQATGSGAGAVAVQALKAGDDLLFITGSTAEQRSAYDAVLAAARTNPAVRSRVYDAVLRVLSLKARYGVLK